MSCSSSTLEPKPNEDDSSLTNAEINAGSWTVEYHYGNSTDSVDFVRNIERYEDAIEEALACLIANPADGKSKYGWPESQRERARAHLFRFGYIGDGMRCYHPRGLTRVEVYFEPSVAQYDNGGRPLTETRDKEQ